MLGAIAGDIIGSAYEWNPVKISNFALSPDKSKFTDDTVLTVAILDRTLNNKPYVPTLKEYGLRYLEDR
jgi:ADP-ribosylglycohydrolase